MNASIETLRAMFKIAHDTLGATLAGMNSEQLHWQPQAGVAPVAAQFAHVVTGEDAVFGMMIGKKPAPLMAVTPTGLSEPPPRGDWGDWAKRVKIDMPKLQAYANSVFAQTDAVLAGMKDADLQAVTDTPAGKMPLLGFITFMLLNIGMHNGEISTLKGLQGLKGYPF